MADKLTVGNIGFMYPSTGQQEGQAGVIVKLQPKIGAQQGHVTLRRLDETERMFDLDDVGDFGKPQVREGKAIVKQIYPAIERALQHKEWPVKEVTDGGWALAQDPWNGNWHWLPPRTEAGDLVYSLKAPYKVAMQGLVLEDGQPAPQPGPGLGP